MSGSPPYSWLFTRGSDSVRLVREESSNGCLLSVYGPATDAVTHTFANVAECITRQAEVEQRLLAQGAAGVGSPR
jgi:hypothetical protein